MIALFHILAPKLTLTCLSTYETVSASMRQQPSRTTVSIVSDVIADVTGIRRRCRCAVVVAGRPAAVFDTARAHTPHSRTATPLSLRSRRDVSDDVIEPDAPVTGCDVTRPAVLLARHVACTEHPTVRHGRQQQQQQLLPLLAMLHEYRYNRPQYTPAPDYTRSSAGTGHNIPRAYYSLDLFQPGYSLCRRILRLTAPVS